MLSHEFFHEQAHIEKRHELKRRILLITICSLLILNSQLSILNSLPIFNSQLPILNFLPIFNSQLSTLNSQLLSTFTLAILYRLFCHSQEFEADRIAAKKCGKNAAIESLKLLQMREGKTNFFANLFSLHPRAEKRIAAL